jgi:hypothetical protein
MTAVLLTDHDANAVRWLTRQANNMSPNDDPNWQDTHDPAQQDDTYRLEWKQDCCGKQDYDAELVSLFCRYWPRGGGFMAFDTATGEWEDAADCPEVRPSARASICLGNENVKTLAEAQFEADTEDEVTAMVEAWAAEMIGRVEAAVRREFAGDDHVAQGADNCGGGQCS